MLKSALFALRYLRRVPKEQLREQALRLSLVWLIGSVLIDLVLFVLIPHPFGFTPAEFYIDYQPWLTLIYAAIFASPLLVMFLLNRRERAERMPTDKGV